MYIIVLNKILSTIATNNHDGITISVVNGNCYEHEGVTEGKE